MNSVRRLIVIEYVTVDGVVQAPGHDREDPDGEFTQGGWSVPFLPDHGRYMREALNTMGALLLGRRTYEIWAPYRPTVTDRDDEVARMLNAVPKYVASTTLASGDWGRTTVVADVPARHPAVRVLEPTDR